MSSPYTNSISSSSTQSFPLVIGSSTVANNLNSEETAMTMIQQPNSLSPPPKKLRNKPGNPSPDAEVIALSPEEITATNKYICAVCSKGFPREQNLQLHRRGHSLPWSLKQKSDDEDVRKKVYVCPEPTCVYHDPSRALGDLTGIKKHYFRKHGEKTFKCGKCPKSYAVESDFKAHSKICGTKEYRCDCGATYTRRDSYDTHRASCGALLQEPPRNPTLSYTEMAAAAAGGGGVGRPMFYGGVSSALSHNHFGNNSNTGYTPLAGGYNLNRSSSETFGNFVPQSTNPNHGPTNFPMQYPSNQGLMARIDQNLMNQQGLINSNNHNNNLFNPGYFQDNTQNLSAQIGVPSLFNNADNNVPSALRRGFSSSPSLSVAAYNFGSSDNGNFQGQMNSLAATSDHQGRPGSSNFDHRFGNNLSMGRSARQTLDLFNGGNMRNIYGRGGRNGPSLDVDMKFSDPNNPFGNV
ncbi:unnamed protein product [Eruca vesicaria subsp. sativa]|uniref:C2H2-type domain-containing protein n=1 Tax=Eruca vesicaria subsp. sativa TaxID=29727 RepID=A0ABC8K6C2_ERUVS|nr:unnamed protein product [Eruca vesicaria subsp. sativa]